VQVTCLAMDSACAFSSGSWSSKSRSKLCLGVMARSAPRLGSTAPHNPHHTLFIRPETASNPLRTGRARRRGIAARVGQNHRQPGRFVVVHNHRSFAQGESAMKELTLAALISLCLAIPAVATDVGGPPQGAPSQDFQQTKAEILKRIDERLARIQQERVCVEAARSHEDARACREKFGPRDRPENRQQPDLKGRPPKAAPGKGSLRMMGPEPPKPAPPRSESEIPATVTGTQGEKDQLDK
jgi:hypothetical protein